MRKEWLRRKRRFWLAAYGVGVLFVGLFGWLMWLVPGDQSWCVWLFAGALLGVLVSARDAPPTAVATWEQGAWGEERTAKELVALERSGWVVLHDLANGSANFDHVVLGPAGVFCLNSKWSGFDLVRDESGRLVGQNRYDAEVTLNLDRILRSAKAEAASLNDTISKRCGRRIWVTPVIVWWGDVEGGGRTVDGVGVVQGKTLVDRLRAQGRDAPMPDYRAVEAILRPGRHANRREAALR